MRSPVRTPPLALAALVALLLTGGAFTGVLVAKPSVAAPTIVEKPAAYTTATSARFTVETKPSNLSLECQLDGGPLTACTSPKTYAGPLAEGSHTFGVRARNNQGDVSAVTTYTWTIDRTPPPAPRLTTTPLDPTNQTAATFGFTDAEDGVTFHCQLDGAAFRACSNPTTYAGLAAGRHTFAVKAIDRAGQHGAATGYAWTIDRTPPPVPVITDYPEEPTGERTATFTFTDAEPGVRLQCQLDTAAYAPCSSPHTYTGLDAAPHVFSVRAVDPAGNVSAPATYRWTVQEEVTGFTLGGDVTSALTPGATAPLNVRITNPFGFAINVRGIAVTPRQETSNPGCDGTVNLVVERPYTGPDPLVVGAGRTASLADLGVPESQWPRLQMPDLPVNQDACKGATYTFDYTATATKVTP